MRTPKKMVAEQDKPATVLAEITLAKVEWCDANRETRRLRYTECSAEDWKAACARAVRADSALEALESKAKQ